MDLNGNINGKSLNISGNITGNLGFRLNYAHDINPGQSYLVPNASWIDSIVIVCGCAFDLGGQGEYQVGMYAYSANNNWYIKYQCTPNCRGVGIGQPIPYLVIPKTCFTSINQATS